MVSVFIEVAMNNPGQPPIEKVTGSVSLEVAHFEEHRDSKNTATSKLMQRANSNCLSQRTPNPTSFSPWLQIG
jgi:hypothetical protein